MRHAPGQRGRGAAVAAVGERTNPAPRGAGYIGRRKKRAGALSLKHARGAKAEVTQAGWIAFVAAEDDVIKQLDVDGLRCLTKHSRDVHVGSARRRIATRVIVGADYTGGTSHDRGTEDFAWMGKGRSRGSDCNRNATPAGDFCG